MTVKTTSSYRLALPDETLQAVRAVAQARGETLAAWLRRAVRTQLYVDAIGPDADTAIKLVRQGSEPAERAARTAADAAQAAVLMLHTVLREQLQASGLPADLATERADAEMAVAWTGADALPPDELPDWLWRAGADGDEGG